MSFAFKQDRSKRIHNAVRLSGEGEYGVYYVQTRKAWGVEKSVTRYGTITVAPATEHGGRGVLLLKQGTVRVPGLIFERDD